jgi:hypothetical protein
MKVRDTHKRGAVLGALTTAILVATASGALAESTQSPEGIGILATGTAAVPATPQATTGSPSPADVASVDVDTILRATTVAAAVAGNTTTASVAGISALGAALLISAGVISSSCTANSNSTFTEASDTASLAVTGVTIPANPGPNTSVGVPGVATLTLNEQVAGPVAGSVTVTALHIHMLTGEDIYIGSSTCGPYNASVPLASGRGLAVGLGTLGLAATGVAAVAVSRRRRRLASAS